MEFHFRPIDVWPHPAKRARRSQFRASWSKTMELLCHEIRKVAGRVPVIQLDLPESKIRRDGLPYVDARPNSPRVIVCFDSKYGPLKYYSDTFDDWQDNVRAIGLGLQALRAVDRYGITTRGEQYTGFKALPAPLAIPSMSTEDAAAFVADKAGGCNAHDLIADPAIRKAAYRDAAKRCHPDNGGSEADFKKLQEAMEIIGRA